MKVIFTLGIIILSINVFGQNCIEIGSTKQEVRNVQGTPSTIQNFEYSNTEIWMYEISSVTFKNGRVKEYSNISRNLRICPENTYSSNNCIEIGSTKDEVRNVQGTPSAIQNFEYSNTDIWMYEISSVTFKNGRVKEYSNISRNLRICNGNESNNNRQSKQSQQLPSITQTEINNQDVGFNPFIGQVKSNVNFRTGPSQSNSIIKNLSAGTQIYVYSNETINGYYKAIDIMTSDIGWIHKDYVKYIQSADINESGAFQSTGYISSYESEVNIRNKSSYNIKLVVGNETFSLNPNSSRTVNIKPGNKYYIATAPGVIPASGHQEFASNNGYEWEFWVETR